MCSLVKKGQRESRSLKNQTNDYHVYSYGVCLFVVGRRVEEIVRAKGRSRKPALWLSCFPLPFKAAPAWILLIAASSKAQHKSRRSVRVGSILMLQKSRALKYTFWRKTTKLRLGRHQTLLHPAFNPMFGLTQYI